jgi:hypothetical protein
VNERLVHVRIELRATGRIDLDGRPPVAHRNRLVHRHTRDEAARRRLLANLDLEVVIGRLHERELTSALEVEQRPIEVEEVRVTGTTRHGVALGVIGLRLIHIVLRSVRGLACVRANRRSAELAPWFAN